MYLFHIQGRTTCKIYNRYLGQKRKKKSYKRNRTPRLVLNFCEFNWENGDNKLLVSWYIFYCFIFTASSNLHREDVLCHYDNDSSSDEGSEFSTDQISLHEKSLTSRISAHYLSTLREVRMALKKNRISHVFNQESWKLCKTFTALIFGSQNNGTSACCEYIGNQHFKVSWLSVMVYYYTH